MKQWIAVSSCLALISFSTLSPHSTVSQYSARDNSQITSNGLNDETQEFDQRSSQTVFPVAGQTNAISPQAIRQYIDQHRDDDECISPASELWHQLGLGIEKWKRFETCKVGIFELDLDREPGAEILLRFYDWDARYLIFKPDTLDPENEWRLLGYIDLEDQRYEVPAHRVVSSSDNHWLVITVLVGRGSGYRLYHDLWYEIQKGGLREVLTYPSHKYLFWGDTRPVLKTEAKLIGEPIESDITTVVIEFSSSYFVHDLRQELKTGLWTRTQLATFVRDPGADHFDFAEDKSELSRREMGAVYDGEGPSCSDILRYNYKEIEKIASGEDRTIREWLRSYVDECKDTTEKRKLLTVLAQ